MNGDKLRERGRLLASGEVLWFPREGDGVCLILGRTWQENANDVEIAALCRLAGFKTMNQLTEWQDNVALKEQVIALLYKAADELDA